jgi:hypothetical protein
MLPYKTVQQQWSDALASRAAPRFVRVGTPVFVRFAYERVMLACERLDADDYFCYELGLVAGSARCQD